MNELFSYKAGKSFLHKMPCWCKILFIPIISIITLCLPFWFCVSLVCLQFILACLLRFSLKEQFTDVKPVFFYAFMLYFVKILGIGMELFSLDNTLNAKDFLQWFCSHFSWQSEKESVFMLLKILCLMQTASLLFKTSTTLQIREAFEQIELFVRRIFKPKSSHQSPQNEGLNAPVATALSLFVCFIPMVSQIWNQTKRAWKARGGKNGLKMYVVLLPVLFGVGLKKAWNSARAIQVRKID